MCARNSFEIRAVHIAGSENRLPDLLSQWHLGVRFQQEFHARPKGYSLVERTVEDSLFDFSHDW